MHTQKKVQKRRAVGGMETNLYGGDTSTREKGSLESFGGRFITYMIVDGPVAEPVCITQVTQIVLVAEQLVL
jgi:hypothetical protein